MKLSQHHQSSLRQYALSVCLVVAVAGVCYPFTEWLGYRTVSLILLLTVSVLAMRFGIGPVFVAAVLSALIWDYFFIPPHFTITVGNAEDALMLLMYFIIAILNGVFTHQVRQYERVVQRKENKERTLHLYNTLFNSLSHELRTPIAAILAASENLLSVNSGEWSEKDRRSMNEEIQASAERLNRLVDNLLNASRLESGHVLLKWDWCDVGELVGAAIQRLRNEIQSRKIELDIPADMPLLRLDFVLMEQAVFNLLHNAVMHTPENTPVRVAAAYQEDRLTLVISDSGPGFEQEDLERVFEKFYRPRGSKPGGVGLGLSIAQGVVQAHHGTIRVANRPEGGAEFTIQIPTGHLDHLPPKH